MGSRETNLKNIRGDFRNGHYNGFGVMQVDVGTDPGYARSWTPQNVEPSIRRGVDIYLSKVRDTQNCVGKKVGVRSRFFVGKAVEADDLRRIATAAYNCGRWAHYHFSRGEHVDSTTTGDDYSRDVYDRAVEFADILEERGYEKMAIHRELALQGKYARKDHREQFGFYDLPERVKLPAGEPQEAQEELTAVDYERDDTPDNPFLVSDDEIDVLAGGIGPTSTAPSDSAGSSSLSDPALNAVEPDAAAVEGVSTAAPAAAAPPEGEIKQTISETKDTPQGERTVEQTVTQPAGDAPDVEPSSFLHLEDWKPFAFRWLKRVWGAVSTITLPGGVGLGFMALKDPPNWFIYVAIAVVVIIIVLGLGLIVSAVLLAIWYFNRKEISAGKMLAAQTRVDPNSKNLGVKIEPK